MGDLISRKVLLDRMSKRYDEKVNIVPDNLAEGFVQMEKLIKEQPTAFDLESAIAELEGNSKYMQSEANDLAGVGDYGTATKLEGMAQAYKDCANILKSATNRKIGE